MAAEGNLVIDISEGQMRAVLPPLQVDSSESESEPEHEPETEALEILLEDVQASYTMILHHLDVCTRGLKEMEAQRRAAITREIELTGAIERAKEAPGRFGVALLEELEKLDATGRPKPEASDALSNGHAESLPASSH
jgi:hypothetical protein